MKENCGVILKSVEKDLKWSYREMTLVADKGRFDALLIQGAIKKRRRAHDGFATAKCREDSFICWRGKSACGARSCSQVADDIVNKVTVLPVEERLCVSIAVNAEVLKGSSWAGKAGEEEDMASDSADDEISASSVQGGKGAIAKSKKRTQGRALLRRPTDTNAVPLFTHTLHPKLIRDFVASSSASWTIFGTPESGSGLMGCLLPFAKAPVMTFARNSVHAKALINLAKHQIMEQCLRLEGEWTSKAPNSGSGSDSSSSSSSAEEDRAAGTGGKTPGDKTDEKEKKQEGTNKGKKDNKGKEEQKEQGDTTKDHDKKKQYKKVGKASKQCQGAARQQAEQKHQPQAQDWSPS